MHVTPRESSVGQIDRSTLPSPEQAPASTLPPDHRLRLDRKQRIPPFEAPCQDSQADSGCGVYPPRPNTALFKKSQLPPKE
jgi:hypothetical protein